MRIAEANSIAVLAQSFRQTHHHRSHEDMGLLSRACHAEVVNPHRAGDYQGIDVAFPFGDRKDCRSPSAQWPGGYSNRAFDSETFRPRAGVRKVQNRGGKFAGGSFQADYKKNRKKRDCETRHIRSIWSI